MNLGTQQAEKIVKRHRAEWLAQSAQFFGRRIKFSTFVVRTDDKNPHVQRLSGLNGWPVELIDPIPMEIHVVELPSVDSIQNHIQRTMRGESYKTHASTALKLLRHSKWPPGLERVLKKFPSIDSMK